VDLAIPIFAFHRVGPRLGCRFTVPTSTFERYLTTIEDEGSSTLTCIDLVDIVVGKAPVPSRSCLLTFDDGYADFWVYALPLLRRYRQRATLFVVANRLARSGGIRPTLADCWLNRCPENELYQLPELPHARLLDRVRSE
jgi:peptidoglycan/xylan/chitin deacetylase (PgdA/CDA1 family)